jgi:hypothetical protein
LGPNPFEWKPILTGCLGQQLGPHTANGSTIGPPNVKPFDGPILCGLNGFSNGIDGYHLTAEIQ